MAETTTQTTDVPSTESEVSPTRLQRLVTKYPRISKIVAVSGVVAAGVGVLSVARTVKRNKGHLDNAVGHAEAGLGELAATVDPMSPEA